MPLGPHRLSLRFELSFGIIIRVIAFPVMGRRFGDQRLVKFTFQHHLCLELSFHPNSGLCDRKNICLRLSRTTPFAAALAELTADAILAIGLRL